LNNTVDYVGDKALKASYGATSSVDNNLYFGAGGAITGNKPSEKITNSLTYQVTRTLADVGCTTFGVITTATGIGEIGAGGGISLTGGGTAIGVPAVAAGTATAGYGAAVTGRSFDSAVDNAGNLIERFTGGGGSSGGSGKWNKGSFDTANDSLEWHFKKHGDEVGAKDVEQYLRKAETFANDLKGATKKQIGGATSGVIRYYKNGKYIDILPDKTIISFGMK